MENILKNNQENDSNKTNPNSSNTTNSNSLTSKDSLEKAITSNNYDNNKNNIDSDSPCTYPLLFK